MSLGRPHIWVGGVCHRCAIRSTWAGAKHGCEGIAKYESEATKASKVESNRRARERKRLEREEQRVVESEQAAKRGPIDARSDLRKYVEALGVAWEPVRRRMARGASLEQAIAGPRPGNRFKAVAR